MELRLKTQADHKFICDIVRKNKTFYKSLNEVNERFFKEKLKDELDWLQSVLDSTYTMIWQDGSRRGFVAPVDIFERKAIVNDTLLNEFLTTYWYCLPENDKLKVEYLSVLEKHFKKKVEGVQINGISSTKTEAATTCSSNLSTSTSTDGNSKARTARGGATSSAKRKASRELAASGYECTNGKPTNSIN